MSSIDPAKQRRVLITVAVSQLLVLTVWFSAAAVAPQLELQWGLSTNQSTLLTLAVQVGFVVGALASSLLNLADVIAARKMFALSALVAAGTNGGLVLLSGSQLGATVALRLLVGISLAGVYPAGLKVMSGWFKARRGMALGVLVGALTVGSAFPHLIRAVGVQWEAVILTSSILAAIGAIVMWLSVSDGPYETTAAPFSLRLVGTVLRNRPVRLATYGYLGHMWELYAMWAWTAVFLTESARAGGFGQRWVPIATFFIIGIGGGGSWIAGVLADKYGREKIASGAMAISGTCAVLTPLLFGVNPAVVVALFLVWGLTVVADSAQFSALVAENAQDQYRGTALTLQTALGFTLTLVTIRGVPILAESVGWRWAFPWLAIGPLLGILAMVRLQQSRSLSQTR